MKDKYEKVQTLELPGAIIEVYRPILSEEERERRLQAIKKAAAELLRGSM